jgi:DNA-binding PadR family transcriptional regulator
MKGEHLGEFEEFILLAVHGLGSEAYGVAVQQLIIRESGRTSSLGPVYTVLARLETKGLLQSHTVAGTTQRGGRRRRVFELTAAGVESLRHLQRVRNRLYGHAGLQLARPRR